MTGPDHYREAERLLERATAKATEPRAFAEMVGAAQVHATLALAAATLGTLEEQRLAQIADDKIAAAMEEHFENAPHIYPDGSTS